MPKQMLRIACVLAVILSWPSAAHSQSGSPEAIAAAKELLVTMQLGGQLKAMVPPLLRQLKPRISQGRPDVERAFDMIAPVVSEIVDARLDDFLEATATIYARNFTADELRQLNAFYREPIGQKLIEKLPDVVQESMALGQKFGKVIAEDLQARMTEELRKRGFNI